jgi:hypothetical protein
MRVIPDRTGPGESTSSGVVQPVARLGVVTPCYDPETGSAAVAGAICLLTRGYEVHVLTGFPNYPIGRFYPGYRPRLYQYEQLAGVHVHRVPLVPSHDRSPIRRAVTHQSFAVVAATRLRLLMYAGTIGDLQGLETAIEAAGLAADAPALAQALRQMSGMSTGARDVMGAAGRPYYLDRLGAEVGRATLAGVVDLAIGHSPGTGEAELSASLIHQPANGGRPT